MMTDQWTDSLPDNTDNTESFQDDRSGRFLKNPLPVPRRRPHTRMEFDLTDDWDIPEDREHFDIEIDENDDFDL